MAKSLFEVPFTITLTGVRLVFAKDIAEAEDDTEATLVVDETNLEDSNLFWDAGTVCLKTLDFKVECGDAIPSTEDPADHFLDPPEDEDGSEGEPDTTSTVPPEGAAS